MIIKEITPNVYDIIEPYDTADINDETVTLGRTIDTGITLQDLEIKINKLNLEKVEVQAKIDAINAFKGE
jgi:hypothetical protein